MRPPVLQGPMADLSCLAPLTRLQHLHTGVGITLAWELHWRGNNTGVGITLAWELHWRWNYTGVGIKLAWALHWRGHYSSQPSHPHPCTSPLCYRHPLARPLLNSLRMSCAPSISIPLSALRNLDLTPGQLPPALSALTLLTHLDIQFLPATSFPSWVTALSSLNYLDVTGNFNVHRSTPFPTEWTAFTGLGSLPTALPTSHQCALPSYLPSPCTSRRAGLNGFTGSIPSTISALTALYDLELYYNNISGTIPAAMANLTLGSLSLYSNMLSGTIPALSSLPLSSLSVLVRPCQRWASDLSYNHLSGSLPTALCAITNALKLGHNDLEGPMPACFDRVRVIRSIEVRSIEVRSIEVRSIEVRSIEVRSIEVRSIEVRSIEVRSIEVRSIEVRSIEVRSIEVRSIEVRSIEVRSIEVRSIEVRSIEVRSIEVRSIEKHRGSQLCDTMPATCAMCHASLHHTTRHLLPAPLLPSPSLSPPFLPCSLAPLSLAPLSLAPLSLAPLSLAPFFLAPLSRSPFSLAPLSLASNSLAPLYISFLPFLRSLVMFSISPFSLRLSPFSLLPPSPPGTSLARD
ncbi:unnamed protein product [Closterium sp. NIES-64]|nr:unnamed protein product [Closterium sp. NIES-64]